MAARFIDFFEPLPFGIATAQLTIQAEVTTHASCSSVLLSARSPSTSTPLLIAQPTLTQPTFASVTTSRPANAPSLDNAPSLEKARSIDYLPKVCHGLVTLEEWRSQPLEQHYEPSPTILWETVSTWEDYVADRRKIFSDSRRRQRKLESELGALTFCFDDSNPATLAQAMAWKSEQYLASGEPDAFANAKHVAFFRTLAQEKLLLVSSLRAGKQLLAVHIGVLADNRLCSWVPAYDTRYRPFAPGRLLLLSLLEASFQCGHREFDFLIGNEPYKWPYATHTRLIAALGKPPISVRTNQWLKAIAKPLLLDRLNQSPAIKTFVKTIAARMGA